LIDASRLCTLFPYTTLFRSGFRLVPVGELREAGASGWSGWCAPAARGAGWSPTVRSVRLEPLDRGLEQPGAADDERAGHHDEQNHHPQPGGDPAEPSQLVDVGGERGAAAAFAL